jgi:hypothetical protein
MESMKFNCLYTKASVIIYIILHTETQSKIKEIWALPYT